MAARLLRLVSAAALACAVAACIQDDGSRFDPVPGRTRMSADSERELGWQFDLEAQKVLPMITDLEVLEFVNDLGNVMIDGLGEQPFDYRFRVIVNPELNAFAVPGGYIYFHSGTLLTTGDVEELAGVLAHELAHVKGHHHARLVQETALPNLLASLAGIAAGAATGSAGPLLAAQGVNVALQLQYTRQFEDEADRVGAVFLTRAGYRPDGMVRFFERILLEKDRRPEGEIPSYLYSHPQVESRIDVVRGLELEPTRTPPRFAERFRAMQQRVAYLVAKGRAGPASVAPHDRARTQPFLDAAAARRRANDVDGALAQLLEAERAEPGDPRVPVLRGDILLEAGRPADAAVAYRRAIHLDPNPPAVLLALGRAHRDAGDRRDAIFFTEQALWRTGARGVLRQQAERQLERLIFPVIAESGFGDERATPASGVPRLPAGGAPIDWWARIGPHYVGVMEYLRVRWTDPSGAVVRDEKPKKSQRVYFGDRLETGDSTPAPGEWKVDVLLANDLVHTQRFVVAD
ncbi:MAG: hypothetical protein DCC71_09650 [Proteobacteria bacterium]|nr:MAG: hypothetical protein DCC71_09650 [Pseudomonadota bacterium]